MDKIIKVRDQEYRIVGYILKEGSFLEYSAGILRS